MKNKFKNNKKRKIAVITGTRSEYGILKPLLTKIQDSSGLKLELIVTGMHLLKKYGLTVNEIKKDGFKIRAKIPMYFGDDSALGYHGKALAKGIDEFTSILPKIKPDMLIVLGDRLEALAAVLAANILRIPIGHIHGGDKTDSGHIDESIRHSISRFSNIHFTATDGHRRRLLKMGEELWRVFKVGALGLDSIYNENITTKKKLFKELNLDVNSKTIICIFHPLYTEIDVSGKHMREILRAIKLLRMQTVIIYPNNDAGSSAIVREIKKVEGTPFIKTFVNLAHLDYVDLMAHADVLIGNSSSGIIEAPTMKLATVNIGSRNIGREHGGNVIFVKAQKNEIIKAIRKALDDRNFKKKIKKSKNPYGDGKTSERIVKILSNIKIDNKLLRKRITY